ncbi:MAG: hypothetical protein DI570_07710 [Phenylobacterium zucineum]|nr:MAG: hypothetical protein DI570_07710 [Phenylobacterium zucineum]
MYLRRLVAGVLGLCILLTFAAVAVKVARSDRVAFAASQIVESSHARLIRIGGRDVTTINVASTAELVAGLKVAKGGETFLLAPGTYSGIDFKIAPRFENPVTITSADPINQAIVTDFRMRNAEGFNFTQLEFATIIQPDRVANDGSYWAYNFRDCANMTFDRITVHGSLDGNASNDVSGITLSGSKNVTITNSEFQQLERAVAFGGGTNIKLIGNNLHDLRTDGFNFVQVQQVEIRGNIFRDFDPAQGDHPDAIQFWTSRSNAPSTDILIAGNIILKGDGDHTQGIFLRDQIGTLPYERVTITDNLLIGTGYNGIRIQGAKDITITNNNLVTFDGGLKTFMLVQGAEGVNASGNSAAYVAFEQSSNVTQTDNQSAGPVKDEGEAAIRQWFEAHPAEGAQLRGMLPVDFVLPYTFFDPIVPSHTITYLDGQFGYDGLDFGSYGGASGFLFA